MTMVIYIPKTGILSISRFCSGMSILNYTHMLTEIFVCNKFLYDHGHGHGYIYRKPVYFLFLYSVVEYK